MFVLSKLIFYLAFFSIFFILSILSNIFICCSNLDLIHLRQGNDRRNLHSSKGALIGRIIKKSFKSIKLMNDVNDPRTFRQIEIFMSAVN